MNFLVSHVTRRPPIKVTQRKLYKDTTVAGIRYVVLFSFIFRLMFGEFLTGIATGV